MKDDTENYGIYKDLKTLIEKTVNDIATALNNDSDNEDQYISTGFNKLKLKKGNLIILAARSSYGKTAFVLNLLLNIATKNKKGAGYITCGDQDENDISRKLLSINSEISLYKIKAGKLKAEDLEKLRDKSGELWNSPIYINDSPNANFAEVELTARLMVEQNKVEILFVDSYEYLREVVDAGKNELPFVHKKLLKDYKQLAKDLNIPIVMLMTLPHSDDDSEPSLFDFKENMIIPRTADVVYLLHRENHEASLITGKNVNGINYCIPLSFCPQTGRYDDKEE